MNYIRHLSAFYNFVKTDNRLTSSHISLYLALFQYWNFNRFQNPFPIYRDDILKLCKIGSKNTYHKCIKQLHQAKYIFYHPASHKYQPVKISMIRLDKEVSNNPDQLDLFSPKIGTHTSTDFGTHASTENGTTHVPNLTGTSPNFEPHTVPKLGHLIKHINNKQERETPAHQIFKKNEKIQNAINNLAGVPKSVPAEITIPSAEQPIPPKSQESEASGINAAGPPSSTEVEMFFRESNFPAGEAKKFYSHYKAIGWKIQGKTPIEDWKALAAKWMENAKKWAQESPPALKREAGGNSPLSPESFRDGEGPGVRFDLHSLYQSFLHGKKIFKYILPEHFDQLKLELNEEIIQQAWKERINQVSCTNQHTLDHLWQAYLTGDPNNELVQKDKFNLIALAKRIAVIKHFQSLKQSGNTPCKQ